MGREDEIIKERIRKIDELRKLKIDPYPYSFDKKNYALELQEKYKKIKPGQNLRDKASVAGRIIGLRSFGKINFIQLQDESGKIQVIVEEDNSGKKLVDFLANYIDSGDFIGVEGAVSRTKRGELSINASTLELLSKSILPLPEKWHGLQDKEERFRLRYLDLIANPEVKEIFKKRSKTIKTIREFLERNGFLEVDTPVLQKIPGGAVAKPFTARYNAYDIDVYLRIAPELYLKRLLIGGFERVFEFARCFRNEGVDWSHNPEFTILEFYMAFSEYNELMKMTEDLIVEAVKEVNGKPEIERNGYKINIKKPFRKITFEKITDGKMTDEAFKEAIKKIKEPTFITNHPISISPLAKKNNDKTVQRFQLIIDGIEIVNAFSELNDPLDQEERFKEQAKKKEGHNYDQDFLDALKYGMPPSAGFGMGIDRFVMLITGKDTLREILLFPFMK